MPVETTRRWFLTGLLGLTVVAVLPKAPGVAPTLPVSIDPWAIQAPPGTTYQWVRSALLGEPDPDNIEKRLGNGWAFVSPDVHPGAPTSTVEHAIETGGLMLMQKPWKYVLDRADALYQSCRDRPALPLEPASPSAHREVCHG